MSVRLRSCSGTLEREIIFEALEDDEPAEPL